MIEAISRKLAVQIKEANPDHPASLEVLKYSLAMIINIVGTLVVSLTAAWLLGHFAETLVAMAAFALLRMISGGHHLNSSEYCLLVTAVAANLIPYITLSDPTLNIITILSMLLALLFAPSNIEHTTRIPPRFFPLLKVVSIALIASNLLIKSDAIALALLIQTLLLIGKKEVSSS
ncbi:accessory gene regulator ArgB-like protein [Paenibacillaceae bacterium WGS1546]|uniref:accessory gene regulator ArgB-like protein n=1 Tax=Cohnella sp. WGS1546 TaxID=3366810 RepID=UPI00372D108E